jgi:hypothetical protein
MAGAYQSQLSPGGQSSFSGAPAEGLAAPIAGALEYGGELMDREIHQRRELDRDMQASAAGVELAKASSDLDKAAIDARTNAAPGGAGHTDSISQMVDGRAQQALGEIRDPRVRQIFTQHWENLKSEIGTREYGWEAGQRVAFQVNNMKEIGRLGAADMAADPDPTKLPGKIANLNAAVDAQTSIDADTKTQLKRELAAPMVFGMANAIATKDPVQILGDPATGRKGILQEPELYHYLDEPQINSLRSSAELELRRQASEQRQLFAQEKAAAVKSIDVLGARVTQLTDWNIPDSDFDAATAGAKKYGLDDKLIDIADWRDLRDTNRIYRTATPSTIEHDTNELAAKVTAGKATPAESLRYKHLQQVGPNLISAFKSDPDAAAARMNNPRPAIDWSNPTAEQLAGNSAWARSFAAAAGMNPGEAPFLPNDIKDNLQKRMKDSTTGRLEVAQQLRAWFQGPIASQVADQLAPGDAGMKLMVGFGGRVAQWYQRGAAAIDSKTVHLGSTIDQAAAQDDRGAMADMIDAYAAAVPVDMVPAIRDAADKISAGMAFEYHEHELTGDQLKTVYSAALQRAGGRTGRVSDWDAPGGFMLHNGRWAWLPANMSTNQALTRIHRAGKEDWVKAGGGVPHYLGSNGKLAPLTDGQISQLSKSQLELYVDPATNRTVPGIYTLLGADGHPLFGKDRKPFHFDIRTLR